MDDEKLVEYAAALGIHIDGGKARLLCDYGEAVARQNERINLTAKVCGEVFLIRHLLDSLTAAAPDEVFGNVVDIGTGGGFPGVAVKVLKPECRVTLVDATGKKLAAVTRICAWLGIEVETLHARAEQLGAVEYRGQFDAVTARAVARLPILLEYCLPLLRVGGALVAMKGAAAEAETAQSEEALKTLGGEVKYIKHFQLPDRSERRIVVVSKTCPTPEGFPRAQKMIARRPIE